MLLQIRVRTESTAWAIGAFKGSFRYVPHQKIWVVSVFIGDCCGGVSVFSQEMTVAIGFCGEQQRAVAALERFLASVGEDVTSQRGSPWELPAAVRAAYSVWR